ncbi:hypothetical protein BHE74_00017278 [Ensete ventricosum]|nr:hypothetical protein BHE74_00017278 [Ensete ventricosum]
MEVQPTSVGRVWNPTSCLSDREVLYQPLVDPTVDRRHVLVGLGSLYGASAAGRPPSGCHCCPPSAGDATEFVIPDPSSPLRVRPAAHSVGKDYIAKLAQGVGLMKALPADDPRSFTQQANVHCAYCDGAYSQVGFPDLELQIVSNAPTPRLFFGNPYRAGDDPNPGGGSLENVPHGPIHVWTGDHSQSDQEDMGNLYSAARDPVFFAHHSNIDRIWNVWKGLGGRRKDLAPSSSTTRTPTSSRSEFGTASTPTSYATSTRTGRMAHANVVEPKFPIQLDSVVTAKVKRPKAARTK